MYRKSLFVLLLSNLLVIPTFALFQTASQALPDKWLHDGRLVVPELNLSMDTPTPDAQWSYQTLDMQGSKATVFVVTTAAGESYLVAVWEKSLRAADTKDAKSLADGMLEALPIGWGVRGVNTTPTNVPLSNSLKYTATIILPDDSTLNQFGYLVPGKRTYIFTTYASAATEPQQFNRFVASFKLIDRTAMQDDPDSRSNPGLAIIQVLAIWGAIADWRYTRAGGVRPTRRDRLNLLTAALACVGLLATIGYMGGNPEALGKSFVFFAGILFALWELGRWRIRRSHPLSGQATTSHEERS